MFHQNNIADPANHIIDIVTYIFDCEEHDGLDEEEQDARDADELPDPDGADEEVPRRQEVRTVDDKLEKLCPEYLCDLTNNLTQSDLYFLRYCPPRKWIAMKGSPCDRTQEKTSHSGSELSFLSRPGPNQPMSSSDER